MWEKVAESAVLLFHEFHFRCQKYNALVSTRAAQVLLEAVKWQEARCVRDTDIANQIFALSMAETGLFE